MTTDKKSSLTERLKAIRDKVAGVITAAGEEESSVATSVFPEAAAEVSPVSEEEENLPVRRASKNEITSALMNFTWAKEQHEAEEIPEKVRIFYTDDQPTIGEKAASEENSEAANAADDAGDDGNTHFEAQEASESESERWDRIIAEAEALLEQDGAAAALPENGPSAETEPLMKEADTGDGDVWEQTGDEVHGTPAADTAETLSVRDDFPQPEPEKPSGFNWAELMGNLTEETPAAQEIKEAEAEASLTSQTEAERLKQAGTGFAALLASLRKDAEKKPSEEEPEASPDLSLFLKEMEENASEPGENEQEPDPADVAKLWEPRADHKSGSGTPEDPAVDPAREETHIFTEEDLKNLPKEEADSNSEGKESISDYRESDDEDEGYSPRDFRPIRRRRYYRTGLVGGIMYFLFVICVSVALACFAWLAADDMLSLNKDYLEAVVYVGEDMDVEQIATELKTKGLIRYRRLFTLFGKFFHAEEKIEPGTYSLSTKLDYRALIQNMHHYTGWTGEELATVTVTIPEGKTVMETFQILAEHGVCPYETLMECAAKDTFDYDFLTDIPNGDATRLEGYLFPDTYEFYADSSPKAAICRFLDNFGERIGDRVTEQAAAQGFTLREILTVASLIEKEAGNDLERATIASVIYNRLQSTSYPYLQIDATIQYAMGEHKEHLTYDDLQVDSPYNTYLYPGLPPGPISNPGLASIRAALSPENTGYYFYALNKNGKHEFFTSYNAFQRFINSSDFGG